MGWENYVCVQDFINDAIWDEIMLGYPIERFVIDDIYIYIKCVFFDRGFWLIYKQNSTKFLVVVYFEYHGSFQV